MKTMAETATERPEPVIDGAVGDERKVLLFSVLGETFGMPIERIKEIIEFGGVTRVPMTPAYLSGVLNLRGSVVPVVDLAARLGKAPVRPDKRTCIVILEIQHEQDVIDIGMVVAAVNEVVDVDETAIQPAPTFGASVPDEFIAGMADIDDGFVVVLNEETTFSVDELAGLLGERYGTGDKLH